MENKRFESYLEAAKGTKAGETKLTDKELMFEAISAMRKLKKFKDAKEARAAIEKDLAGLKVMLDKIEDTISDMVYEVASILQFESGDEDNDDIMEEAFDKAHAIFSPLMKGVNAFDFKRVKESIMAHVARNIDSKHEKEANAASEKAKAEAPTNAE